MLFSCRQNVSDIIIKVFPTRSRKPRFADLKTYSIFNWALLLMPLHEMPLSSIWALFYFTLFYCYYFFLQRKTSPTNSFPQSQPLVWQSQRPCTSLLSSDWASQHQHSWMQLTQTAQVSARPDPALVSQMDTYSSREWGVCTCVHVCVEQVKKGLSGKIHY